MCTEQMSLLQYMMVLIIISSNGNVLCEKNKTLEKFIWL